MRSCAISDCPDCRLRTTVRRRKESGRASAPIAFRHGRRHRACRSDFNTTRRGVGMNSDLPSVVGRVLIRPRTKSVGTNSDLHGCREARVAGASHGPTYIVCQEASMQKAFIVIGLVIVAIGLAWPWISKLPIGRLPGDIVVDRPGFKFFFPITTMIIVSIVLSLLLWLFRR